MDQKLLVTISRNSPIVGQDMCLIKHSEMEGIGQSGLEIKSGSAVSKWLIWPILANWGPMDHKPLVAISRNSPILRQDMCLIKRSEMEGIGQSGLEIKSGSAV